MRRKIEINTHLDTSIKEVYTSFVISKTSLGVSETTLNSYKYQFRTISKYIDMHAICLAPRMHRDLFRRLHCLCSSIGVSPSRLHCGRTANYGSIIVPLCLLWPYRQQPGLYCSSLIAQLFCVVADLQPGLEVLHLIAQGMYLTDDLFCC